jgi:hypothetical protein
VYLHDREIFMIEEIIPNNNGKRDQIQKKTIISGRTRQGICYAASILVDVGSYGLGSGLESNKITE